MSKQQTATCEQEGCGRPIHRSTHGDNWWGAWMHDHNQSQYCVVQRAIPDVRTMRDV